MTTRVYQKAHFINNHLLVKTPKEQMNVKRLIRIVTRKSVLAIWQAEFFKQKLHAAHPNINIEILGISTRGDEIIDIPLHKTGGKGLFVKELEDALLNHVADIAVHSMKDIPAFIPAGLEIAAILEREDPRDAFVSNQKQLFLDLPAHSRIGTSSLRRQAQLAAKRPDLRYEYLRGNVDTRIKKLDQNEYDAVILAVAGLKRLNLETRIKSFFDPEWMLPCVGQGALGIECREEDSDIKKILAPFNHLPTALCITAERSMNERLGGSCQLPVGGLATFENASDTSHPAHSSNASDMLLSGMVGLPDGSRIIKASATGFSQNANALGKYVAEQLLKQGAKDIIDACH